MNSDEVDLDIYLATESLGPLRAMSHSDLNAWLTLHSDIATAYGVELGREDRAVHAALLMGLGVLGQSASESQSKVPEVVAWWTLLASDCVIPVIAGRAAQNLWTFKSVPDAHLHARTAIQFFERAADGGQGLRDDRAELMVDALVLAADLNSTDDIKRLVLAITAELDGATTEAESHRADAVEVHRAAQPRGAGQRAISLSELEAEEAPRWVEIQHHRAAVVLLRGLSQVARGRNAALVSVDQLRAVGDHLSTLVAPSEILTRSLFEVRLDLAGGDEPTRKRVVRETITADRSRLDRVEAPARYVRLTQLEQLARSEGLPDIAEVLQTELQLFSRDDLGLKHIRVASTVPTPVVEGLSRMVDEICTAESLSEALRRLALFGAVWEAAEEDRQVPERPLAMSLPSITIGEEGVPQQVTAAGEDNRHVQLVRTHNGAVQFHAESVVTPALSRLLTNVTREDVVVALTELAGPAKLLDQARVECCADALLDWSAERYDAALHTLVPRVEYAVRQRAKSAGVSVIRPTDGTLLGGFETFGAVLETLRGQVDEKLRRHLQWTLCDPVGLNLRNVVAHGGVDPGSAKLGAIAAHVLLVVLAADGTIAGESPPV